MQIFAAESHAPRTRRAIDVAALIGGSLLLWGLVLVTDDASSLEERWIEFANEIPTWIQWLADAIYLSGWVYFLFLIIGLGLVARRRHDLFRDMIVALLLPVGAAIALGWIVSGAWPDIPLFMGGDSAANTFPAISIATLTAVHAAAAPYLSRPLRRLGWTIVVLASTASLISNILLFRDVVGALLLGVAVAALVHLVFGSPAGRPSLGRITTAAGDLRINVSDLVYAPVQPESFTIAEGTTEGGVPVRMSVLGRDAGSDIWINKAWRFAWYHEAGSPFGAGRRQRVEHAALAQVLAQRGGACVGDLVAVGTGGAGDALLICRTDGVALAELPEENCTDELLDSIWAESLKLHEAGLAHGQLNANHINIGANSEVMLLDFESSKVSVGEHDQHPDQAELLVSSALLVGPERALAAAHRALGDEPLAAVLPYLQSAALTPELRHEVRAEKLSLKELRAAAAELTSVEDIKLEQLRRVSIGKILLNAVLIIAVYVVMTALAQIGFEEIWTSIQGATWSLVLIALVLTQLTNAAQAVAVVGAAPKPMPLGVTTTEQFAISFINLAIPSTAARVAVNMRFYQRFGIGTSAAATAGVLTSVSGFVVQIILLFMLIVIGDQSIDWSQLNFSGTVLKFLVLAVGIGLVALIVMLAVKRLRKWIIDLVREPIRNAGTGLTVLRSPHRVLQMLGGNFGEQLLYAMGLMLCVYAVGGSVTLPEVIFINTVVSLFAGLMPIPGGMGVTEAGLTAGLVAVGLPQETALAAVIIYRICSYYLPPVWGWLALRWLTKNDYL